MKVSKKGKNPGAVDFWLDSLGYFRKNVAYDETCLFRAVSEQVNYTQLYHEDIRKKCITFGKQHSRLFQDLVPNKKEWFSRLHELSVHMLVCNEVEIHLICETFNVDIVMFIGATQQVKEFQCDSLFKFKTLYICKMGEDHYDAVYTKSRIENAGFCQSIVYSLLYENVFQIPDVPGIVNKMLHEKEPAGTICTLDNCRDFGDDDEQKIDDSNNTAVSLYGTNLIAPFPFKIAKALDPDMYRNIEYDTWLEVRRDLRLGDWYYGDHRLILGTRCLVTRNEKDYVCYVQLIKPKQNKCEVYVTECGQRWTVNYSELRPEADAKPWPLPYRFTKSLALQLPNSSPSDADHKSLRKRRERRQLKIEKSEESEEASKVGIENFRGCPLLMHSVSKDGSTTKMATTNDNVEAELDENANSAALEPLQWQSQTVRDDSFPNLGTPMPAVSNSPVFYQDSDNNQYYNDYNAELTYPSPVVWPPPQYVFTPDSAASDLRSPFSEFNRNTPKLFYYPTDLTSPNYMSSPITFPPPPSAPPITPQYTPTENVFCNTPVIPSPHVDMYSMMYPVQPPTTPVYYSHSPSPISTTRPADCVAPNGSAMPVYNSPLDMPYLTPPAYLFPPTPPVAWYSPHVNAQGFIYPTTYNN